MALKEIFIKYADYVANDPKKPKVYTFGKGHDIETGRSRAVKAKYSRVDPKSEQEIDRQVKQMLSNGVVRPSSSPWASRVILVQKKDGAKRFVVDFRALNDCTKKDAYPLPDIRDVLNKLDSSQFLFYFGWCQCLLEHSYL